GRAAPRALPSRGGGPRGRGADPRPTPPIPARNLLLLAPEPAAITHRAGWSKADVRSFLYRRARLPFGILRANREPATIVAGRPDLQWLADHPDLEVPLVDRPECFELAVVGGAAGRSMYFWGAHEAVTRVIERRDP